MKAGAFRLTRSWHTLSRRCRCANVKKETSPPCGLCMTARQATMLLLAASSGATEKVMLFEVFSSLRREMGRPPPLQLVTRIRHPSGLHQMPIASPAILILFHLAAESKLAQWIEDGSVEDVDPISVVDPERQLAERKDHLPSFAWRQRLLRIPVPIKGIRGEIHREVPGNDFVVMVP